MQVRVELELRLNLPDDTEDLRKAVGALFFEHRNKPAALLMPGLKIVDVTRPDPWDFTGGWEEDAWKE